MVGKAVQYGFPSLPCIISDPEVNNISVEDVCDANPKAVFVCVPTPTDDTNYQLLTSILSLIAQRHYTGLVVVKSTVLYKYIEEYDVVYNPEFLSRATSYQDFVNPPMLILGGKRAQEALELYEQHSIVNTNKKYVVDIKTASLVKYIMNSFYATKLTFMNSMYDVVEQCGGNYGSVIEILKSHPWMGTHHFDVPGPDGQRGFGGPCLPKDTAALVKHFDVELLNKVLELNEQFRK